MSELENPADVDMTDYLHRLIEFVLQHGKPWPLGDTVANLGTPNRCFSNSLERVKNSPYPCTYCEGFGYREGVFAATHHAWCIDPLGNVVETTWSCLGTAYFGVRFAAEFIQGWGQDDADMAILRPHNLDKLAMLNEKDWKHSD